MRQQPALVLAQCGGPTAVVNASIVGAIQAAQADPVHPRVLGARFGFEGVLHGDFYDLSDLPSSDAETLCQTPGAALGSSRYRPSDGELDELVARLTRDGVTWLAIVGGNDTAETLHRLHEHANGSSMRVVGIPKTIDNDLPGMDHCPGYGSAARYLAQSAREASIDTMAMRRTDPVKVVEVMGRNAGWLAAASALGRGDGWRGPQVIFLPERPRTLSTMLEAVQQAYEIDGWAVVVICENQRDAEGVPIGGSEPIFVDPHAHAYYESPGLYLTRAIQTNLGLRARYERPGSLQRTTTAALSETDVTEARRAGAEAVRRALAGESDVMVAIQRRSGPGYDIELNTIPLLEVAHQERKLPDAFIAASGTDVSDAFITYARPLIGAPLPALWHGAL